MKMTVGKKIGTGFGLVLALLVVLAAISYTGVESIVKNAEQSISGNRLDGVLAQKEVDHLNWTAKVNSLLTDEKITSLSVQTDDHKCGFGKWLYGKGRKDAQNLVTGLAPLLAEIEAPHGRLHASAKEIGALFRQADPELGNFLREKKNDHLLWMHKVKDVLLDSELQVVDVEMDPEKCSLGRWILSAKTAEHKNRDQEFSSIWNELVPHHKRLHRSAEGIQALLSQNDRDKAIAHYRRETRAAAHDTLAAIDRLIAWNDAHIQGMRAANAVYAAKTLPALGEVQKLLEEIRLHSRQQIISDEAMLDSASKTRRNVSVIGLVAIVFGLLLATFIARSIARVLQGVSARMSDGAAQVASASGQVASASASLAQGASEQAASLEETSASLEEMTAMTSQNAGNASQADSLMKEANDVVERANSSMEVLVSAMAEIARASEETSRIIRTIDEIAFQTNLLALNAAVEAARAGQAGAGFAVVADEVRNLAMRAAEAARNTASLIEGTVKRVDEGAALVAGTGEEFAKVAETVSRVGQLVAEISQGSSEQAQGIEQVNRAVIEMDGVTQQNAANAEQSAGAAEQMNLQAGEMKHLVEQLTLLVGGGSRENRYLSAQRQPENQLQPPAIESRPQIRKEVEVRPDRVIPMDDDFSDF